MAEVDPRGLFRGLITLRGSEVDAPYKNAGADALRGPLDAFQHACQVMNLKSTMNLTLDCNTCLIAAIHEARILLSSEKHLYGGAICRENFVVVGESFSRFLGPAENIHEEFPISPNSSINTSNIDLLPISCLHETRK